MKKRLHFLFIYICLCNLFGGVNIFADNMVVSKTISLDNDLKKQFTKEEKKLTTHIEISSGTLSYNGDVKFLNSLPSLESIGFKLDQFNNLYFNPKKFSIGYKNIDIPLSNIKSISYSTNQFNALEFTQWKHREIILPDLKIFPNIQSVKIICQGMFSQNVSEIPDRIVPVGVSPDGWQLIIFPQQNIVEIQRITSSNQCLSQNAWIYGTFQNSDVKPRTLDDDMNELFGETKKSEISPNIFIPSNIIYIGPYTFAVGGCRMPTNHPCISGNLSTESSDTWLYIDSYAFNNLFNNTDHSFVFDRPVKIFSNAFIENGSYHGLYNIKFNQNTDIYTNAFELKIKHLKFNSTENRIQTGAFTKVDLTTFSQPQINIQAISRNFVDNTTRDGGNKSECKLIVPETQISEFRKYGFEPQLSDNYISNIPETILELKEPGTLLSHISSESLKEVQSLTIVGYLDDNDINVLSKLGVNLIKLDLSLAYTTLSEETQRERRENASALAALFGMMSSLADAKYQDYSISSADYIYVKSFSDIVQKAASNVKVADKNCVIPRKSLSNMPKLEIVILPIWCNEIEQNAFWNCPRLSIVKLPNAITKIDRGAFGNCVNLSTINFPASLTLIGSAEGKMTYNEYDSASAFDNCISIKSVDLSKCIWSNKSWGLPFYGCKIETLRLPQGLDGFAAYDTKIVYAQPGINHFNGRDATIYFKDSIPPDPKRSDVKNCTLYVPKGSITAWYAKFGDNNKIIEY